MIRLLTAAIAVPLLYLLLVKLPPEGFRVIMALVSAAGLFEFLSLTKMNVGVKWLTVVAGTLPFLFGTLPVLSLEALLALAVLLILSIRLFHQSNPKGALFDVGVSLAGMAYIPLLLLFQVFLRERGTAYLVFLYVAVWSCDALALYAGTWLGRHKLYPSMSPNKTVEGAIGGLAGGILGAVAVNALNHLMPTPLAIGLGLLLSAAGQIGDLVESMLKRDAGVKDSGAWFPGHGGVLDKIDALLFAGPVLYLALELALP